MFYHLQLFLGTVRLSMDFKHQFSFEPNFKGMRMLNQEVTLNLGPGNLGDIPVPGKARAFGQHSWQH